MRQLSQDSISAQILEENVQMMKEADKVLDACGYYAVGNYWISHVHIGNVIVTLNAYLPKLLQRLYKEYLFHNG